MGQISITVSAVVSALAASSVAILTFFLVRATNQYVHETSNYVRLVQEQLILLRAQMAAPLLLDADTLLAAPPKIFVRCRHSGNPSSLPVIISAVRFELRRADAEEAPPLTDEQSLNEVVDPGRIWARWFRGSVVSMAVGLPTPSLGGFLLGRGPGRRVAGHLSVILRFQRGGQEELEQVVREYEIHSRVLGPPKLVAL